MGSHALHYCKLTPWTVSKKKWDTKEDKGKSVTRAFTYCGMPKGTSTDEVTSNSEKSKPVALAVIKLRLSESIGQVVGQSVEMSIE